LTGWKKRKPGGGKTLYAVRLIVDELVRGSRPVITNVPLNLGRLNEFLQQKFSDAFASASARFQDGSGVESGRECDAYVAEMAAHISNRVILLDEDDLPKFFTYRGGGVRLDSVSNQDWKAGKRPDFRAVKDRGVFYVLDEVHIAFNARAWADTGHEVLYYLSQHRKLGDDVICVTQSVNNVDRQFRSVAQDYTYIHYCPV
jgi:zona occludens toxin (predicted ATPase)